MVADVSGLVQMLATQPGQNVARIGEVVGRAQESVAARRQQEFENARKAERDKLEAALTEQRLGIGQLEEIKLKTDITTPIAQSVLMTKDPIARSQILEESIPTLKKVGMPDQAIEEARQNLNNPYYWRGKVASGLAAKDVYASLSTSAEPPKQETYREGEKWVTDRWNPQKGEYERIAESPIKEAGTNISIYGEKAAQEFTKDAVRQMAEASKQAAAARKANTVMQYADQALKGIDTGNLADTQLALGKFASSLGIEVGDIPNMEAAKGAYGDLVKAQLEAFPGAISEGERAYAIEISPNLAMTPKGRRKLTNLISEVNKRAIEYQRQMDKYIKNNPSMNLYKEGEPSFVEVWDDYVTKHPLSILSEEKKNALSPEVWGSSEKAIKAKDGQEYRAIGGKWINRFGEEYKGGR